MRLAVLGFLALAQPQQVMAAGTPTVADRARITACLDAAVKDKKPERACIGLIADPCIKGASISPEGQRACAARELAIWSDMLVPLARDRLKSAPADKDISAPVASAYTAWTTARDRLCAVFDHIDPGMYPGGASYCLLQQTGLMVVTLRALKAATEEH